jgi:hypothetical protein
MPQYALARHVFVCVQGEHVVFLDVRKDRYFALESAKTAGLGYFVPGWPVAEPIAGGFAQHTTDATARVLAETVDHATLSGVISVLLQKEILTADPAKGKSADATAVTPLRGDLTADALDERPRIGPLLFSRFITAAIRAQLLLNYKTFETVVERVKCRPKRATSITESELLALVSAFARLRPFFFTAKDACLFDALSLCEFLAGYRVFPNWVFGVQSRPFAAHCWLELDGVVLNDTVDYVQRYKPIMVV